MSGVLRSVKNVTKGYSSVQVKVRNATSNDPWGPTGTDMADIARVTYNNTADFYEVVDMLDKRLNDKGKNWRHVLKSLKVLDYCLHEGSELVVTWARKNIYVIKTLREFRHYDDEGRDVGASIRSSAKELTTLILDEDRLRAERLNRGAWKSRVTGLEDYGQSQDTEASEQTPRRKERRPRNEDDDLELRLALEASKNMAEEDAARRAKGSQGAETDDDLAKAIKLSKEEEELRKRQLEDQNQEDLLFDPTPEQAPQPTGFNQGYQQQAAVDWFGNPMQQQQTGYLNNAYNQPTGFQNGFGGGYGYQQQQPTGMGSYEQMQQPQQQFLQQQNTYNPWGQQMNGLGNQQQQQQQPIQEQPTAQPGSNNPWASNNQNASPLQVQPTGSNNPFATQRPQTSSAFRAPTLDSLAEQKATQQFNPRPNPIQNFQAPVQQTQIPPQQTQSQLQPQSQQKPQDPYSARLNHLLATGEGQDTFGNVGDLRIPSQHTAPGTYVNSAGGGSMGRLEAARTGNNPFFSPAPGQQQYPAQTGPAGAYGGNNPFGSRAPMGQQGGQSGSLIDL